MSYLKRMANRCRRAVRREACVGFALAVSIAVTAAGCSGSVGEGTPPESAGAAEESAAVRVEVATGLGFRPRRS